MPEVENKPKNLVKNRSPQGHFEGQDTIPLRQLLTVPAGFGTSQLCSFFETKASSYCKHTQFKCCIIAGHEI